MTIFEIGQDHEKVLREVQFGFIAKNEWISKNLSKKCLSEAPLSFQVRCLAQKTTDM